jgi:hypothetical protein
LIIGECEMMDSYQRLPENTWRTATFCGPNGGNCVEVNLGVAGVVGVRDSKRATSPVLAFRNAGWGAFVAMVGAGELDRG